MKLSKKILSVLTATALVASLAGCGAGQSSDSEPTSDVNTDAKKYTVGICQLVEHEALDAATKGFTEALTEKLGKDNVTFDYGKWNSCPSGCYTGDSRYSNPWNLCNRLWYSLKYQRLDWKNRNKCIRHI